MKVHITCHDHKRGHLVESLYVAEPFAVTPYFSGTGKHKWSDTEFVVTHMPTGHHLNSHRDLSLDDARRLIDLLNRTRIDWTNLTKGTEKDYRAFQRCIKQMEQSL